MTGGAGFIGSHLTEALLARGMRVTVVDDESTGDFRNLDAVRDDPRLKVRPGSIGQEELLREVLEEVDEVYHLAAAVGVALIASDPIATIETNISPTLRLLRHLHQRRERGETIRCFLASSSEVYGKNPKPVWRESDDIVLGATTSPRWSYGASKAIDEFLALAYWKQYRLPVVVGRFFNVVGPRQVGSHGMVLPRFVEAATRGRPLVVHDDGQQVRCFAHVSDVVRAVLALMQSPSSAGQVFNVGSDRPVKILDLARLVIQLAGSASEVQFQTYRQAYGADFEDTRCRVPDLSRLRAEIAWQPSWDLPAIIRELLVPARRSDTMDSVSPDDESPRSTAEPPSGPS